MKKLCIIILFIPLLLLSGDTLFKVTFYAGKSYYKVRGSHVWKPIRSGMLLYPRHIIKTGSTSVLIIQSGSKKLTLKSRCLISMKSIYKNAAVNTKTDYTFYSRFYKIISNRSRSKSATVLGGVRGDRKDTGMTIKWADDLEKKDYLKEAENYYKKGKLSKAIDVLTKNKGTIPPEKLNNYRYLLGLSYFQNGDFKESIVQFTSVDDAFKDKQKNQLRLLFLAMAYHYNNNNVKSHEILNTFFKMYPGGAMAPDAYYFKALIHLSQNQKAEAKKVLQIITTKYPNSKTAAEAREKLKKI